MLYLLSTSCVLTLASSLLFPLGYATAAQFLPTRGSSSSATRTTRTSRCSSPSRRPCGALLQPRRALFVFIVLRFRCIRHFVIIVINNIRISIYYILFVICAMIYCSFCCIYVWLDPGTYMIARFMFFYKPGVTRCFTKRCFWLGVDIQWGLRCSRYRNSQCMDRMASKREVHKNTEWSAY